MSDSPLQRLRKVILRNPLLRASLQLLAVLTTLPLYLLGYLIPRKKELWIFANFFGYCDNCRYLFDYVRKNHPEITAAWIHTDSTDVPPHTPNHFYRFSLRGIACQYRASVVFLSTGQGELARWTLAGKTIVQLWHGIPIKRILLDSPATIPLGGGTSWAAKVALRFLRYELNKYSLVIASSTLVQQRMMSAFGLNRDRVTITGYPRHDIILGHSGRPEKRIIYAPTWRSDIRLAEAIVRNICDRRFIEEVNRLGYELWLSIHPLNDAIETSIRSELAGKIVFVQDRDINLVLARSEVLITDYSSVAIDFSILNRQLVFFAPDIDDYLGSRGLYREFESILRDNALTRAEEVLHVLHQSTARPIIDERLYFKWHDTGSRARIINQVKRRYLGVGKDETAA